jgi:hypothetical protein
MRRRARGSLCPTKIPAAGDPGKVVTNEAILRKHLFARASSFARASRNGVIGDLMAIYV